MFPKEKTIKFYQEKKEYRIKMRQYLPIELQLAFPQDQPGKEKWNLGGLAKLKESSDPEAQLFVKMLELERKRKIGQEISKTKLQEIEKLNGIVKEKKKKLYLCLKRFLFAKQIVEKCRAEGDHVSASKIAIELAKSGQPEMWAFAKQMVEKCLAEYWSVWAGEIAVELVKSDQPEMWAFAKQIAEQCQAAGDYVSASKIAVELAKNGQLEMWAFAKQMAEQCLATSMHNWAGEIAVELAKSDQPEMWAFAKQIAEQCRTGGDRGWAGKIAVELAKSGQPEMWAFAKQMAEKCRVEGDYVSASKIAVELAKNGQLEMWAFAKQIAEQCRTGVDRGWAGEIAVELAKSDQPEMWAFAKQIAEQCRTGGDRGWAGEIAVELAKSGQPEMWAFAKQIAEQCQAAGEYSWLVWIVIELAKSGQPEMRVFAKQMAEKCRVAGEYVSAGKIAIELDKGVQQDLSFLTDILQKHTDILQKHNVKEKFYLYQIIANCLQHEEDLGKLFTNYLPAFQKLQKESETINQRLSEEKVSTDVKQFWQTHQVAVAKLQSVDSDLTVAVLSEYLKNYGFPRLETFFQQVVSLSFDTNLLTKYLPSINQMSPELFFRLVELSSAYQRMGLSKQLNQELALSEQQSISADQMIKRLGQQLLTAFVEKFKIKVNVSQGKGLSLAQWNLDYLPKLFTAEAGYKPEDKELLRLIMKLSFQEDDFLSALFGQKVGEYTSEEQEYLADIRKYNEKLVQEFIDNGLDLDQWLHYQSKEVFLIGPSADQLRRKKELFMKNLLENIEQLLGSHQRKQVGLLTPSQAKQAYHQIIKKYHLQIGGAERLSTEKGAIAIKDLAKVLREFNQLMKQIQQGETNKAKKAQIGTILDHLQELVKQLPNLDQELAQRSYQLSIQPWQRQPGYDLFQGNYTHCCVAVENFNRGAMLDYLIDAGLQVVEIKDETLNKTIAQTWLWLAKDKQGELNLILDNVEINGDYMGISDDIKKKLFAYLKKYSQAFGKGKIKRILLGTSYNDVKDDDLKTVNLTISKLAGAPRGEEYLDAMYPHAGGSHFIDPSKERTVDLKEVK